MRVKRERHEKLNANIQNIEFVDPKNYCRFVPCNYISKCQNR